MKWENWKAMRKLTKRPSLCVWRETTFCEEELQWRKSEEENGQMKCSLWWQYTVMMKHQLNTSVQLEMQPGIL